MVVICSIVYVSWYLSSSLKKKSVSTSNSATVAPLPPSQPPYVEWYDSFMKLTLFRHDNGSAEYIVEKKSIDDNSTWSECTRVKDNQSVAHIMGMCYGMVYQFRLIAVNGNVRSAPGAPSKPIEARSIISKYF